MINVDLLYMTEFMEMGDRLKAARRRAGFSSATKAADALGVSASTYRAHENGQNEFRIHHAEQYAKKFGVSLMWLMRGEDTGQNQKMGPVTDNVNQSELGPLTPVVSIPVIGSVKAGGWLRVDELNSIQDVDFPSIGVVMKYPQDWQYAFTVEGTSLNKVAVEGDTLVCVDMIKSGMEVTDNKLVIVERTMHDGSMIERTAKRVRKTSFGFELWPESTDPAHQEPIVINGGSQHEEVRIKAIVVFVVKEP